MEVDDGTEFKGVTKTYFDANKMIVRVAKTGRHRQQAVVERRNQSIGVKLFKRMAAQELITGEPSKEWIEDLHQVIKDLNKIKVKKQKVYADPVCEGDSCQLLPLGAKVRVMLEAPKGVQGEKLHGKFRATDIRWSNVARTIKNVVLKKNLPPLYILDGNVGEDKIEPVGYTKNQLQLIGDDEQYPDGKTVIRGKPKTYIINKLVSKKTMKGKIYYEVLWRGFKDTTWEPRSELIKDQKKMVLDYENKQIEI